MALIDELEPTQSVVDLLDGTTASDWSNAGAKPANIERTEELERHKKKQRTTDAVYVHTRETVGFGNIDPEGNRYDEVARVTVEVWTPTSAARADALKRDVLSIVADKANDNNTTTNWVDWWPDTSTDYRAQKTARRGDHYIESVTAELRDPREAVTPTGGTWGGTAGVTYGGTTGGTWG